MVYGDVPLLTGHFFLQKIPKHGVGYWAGKSLNRGPVSDLDSKHIVWDNIFAKYALLVRKQRKIPKNKYYFWPKWPLNTGMGFAASIVHPRSNQIRVPPPPGHSSMRLMSIINLIHPLCNLSNFTWRKSLTCLKLVELKSSHPNKLHKKSYLNMYNMCHMCIILVL